MFTFASVVKPANLNKASKPKGGAGACASQHGTGEPSMKRAARGQAPGPVSQLDSAVPSRSNQPSSQVWVAAAVVLPTGLPTAAYFS